MKSSTQNSDWGIGLQIAQFAADAIPLEASVAMGTFSEHLQLSEFQDRTTIIQQVLTLGKQEPKHRTALYDAVSNASSLFQPAQFGDAIYLVTDGGDNYGSVDLRRLEDELIVRGVRVFVFLAGASVQFHTPEEREGPVGMADLARETGGGLISLPWSGEWFTKPEAAVAAKNVKHQATSAYRMELQLASPLVKPAKISITIPRDPKAYTIVYPRRVEPCSQSASK